MEHYSILTSNSQAAVCWLDKKVKLLLCHMKRKSKVIRAPVRLIILINYKIIRHLDRRRLRNMMGNCSNLGRSASQGTPIKLTPPRIVRWLVSERVIWMMKTRAAAIMQHHASVEYARYFDFQKVYIDSNPITT